VIGQIHGPDDELCRLYFDNGKVFYVNDKSGDSMKETTFELKDNAGKTSNILLGDDFTYSISVKAGYLRDYPEI